MQRKKQRHDLLLHFIHLLSLPCILNCSRLDKLSSGFTSEVLIILIHRKGCDRITLSAKQGRWWPYLVSVTASLSGGGRKGSFDFNTINRNPKNYYWKCTPFPIIFTGVCHSSKLNYIAKLQLNKAVNFKCMSPSYFIIKWYSGTRTQSRVMQWS